MSDLGLVELVERPLIIREARAGGRKVTKAIYMQLPRIDGIPFPDDSMRIVAWVNHHWEGCAYHRGRYRSLLDNHRHLIIDHQGVPKRGTTWEGYPTTETIAIYDDDIPGGKELTAIFARQKLAGSDSSKSRPTYAMRTEVQLTHNGHRLSFRISTEHAQTLFRFYTKFPSQEPDHNLVALCLPAMDHATLQAEVDKAIALELAWRVVVAELWKLVTTETPQVFL